LRRRHRLQGEARSGNAASLRSLRELRLGKPARSERRLPRRSRQAEAGCPFSSY
jgi:hypothetical protein